MKNFLIRMMLLTLIATACSPMQTTSELPAEENDSTVPPVDTEQALDPIEETVVKRLAENLGLDESDIAVVSDETVEFSDGCLGITMPDVKCPQVVTPGRIIILEVDDIQYEYHTDVSGKSVQPATLALTWKREGGIAGFCDNMMVFRSGEVYGYNCKTVSDAKIDTFAKLLSASERAQFNEWMTEFDQITLDASDPRGVSDRMEVVLEFYGLGSKEPSDIDQQEVFAWAQDLFQKLYS